MRSAVLLLAAVSCLGVLSVGCTSYMPIAADDIIHLRVEGQALGTDDGGQQFNAVAAACFGKENGFEKLCGARVISDDYDEDEITVEGNPLVLTGPDNNELMGIRAEQVYGIKLIDALPGEEFRFAVNEFSESIVKMPLRLDFSIEVQDSRIDVGNGDVIPLHWSPPGDAQLSVKVMWCLEVGTKDRPCQGVKPIKICSDEINDDNYTEIPNEVLPKDLPFGGCAAVIHLRRIQHGRLDPNMGGSPLSDIIGQQSAQDDVLLVD